MIHFEKYSKLNWKATCSLHLIQPDLLYFLTVNLQLTSLPKKRRVDNLILERILDEKLLAILSNCYYRVNDEITHFNIQLIPGNADISISILQIRYKFRFRPRSTLMSDDSYDVSTDWYWSSSKTCCFISSKLICRVHWGTWTSFRW